MSRRPDLTEAKQKAARYCAFQERSPKEVTDKLKSWGLPKDQIQITIEELISQGFVDPKRFANAYCNDKFEFNSWGKQKIRAQIYQHQLDPKIVESALSRIDEDKYSNRLAELARKKWNALEHDEISKRKKKTLSYLSSKGFESDLIWSAIEQLSH
jgi:regulatory protein